MTGSDEEPQAGILSPGNRQHPVSQWAVPAGCLALLAWSVAGYVGDARARRDIERFAQEFSLEGRRPADVATMRLEPAADGAAAVMASAALDDGTGRTQLSELSPEVRELWLRSTKSLDTELSAAQSLILTALARRPGWAQNSLLLGQLVYTAQSRQSNATAKNTDPWLVPLRRAISAAPGLDSAWTFLGGACLERWNELDAAARLSVPEVLKRAFASPDFVSRAFGATVAVFGAGAAAKLVPDQMKPLRAAADVLASQGDVAGAAALLPGLDRAARKERQARLGRLRQLVRLGDVDEARAVCRAWVQDFPPEDFDDQLGRQETAEVLDLWPGGMVGSWRSDPRAGLIRFFLARREDDVNGATLLRALRTLTDVPEASRALVLLLAGEEEEAADLARESLVSNTFEWSPFYVQLAEARLERGDLGGAREALALVPPSARGGCDVLLTRRRVAAALGDERETAVADQGLQGVERRSYSPESWSAGGSISLCLPGSTGSLRFDVEAESPAILRCGWNGGRLPPVLISGGRRSIRVSLPRQPGRQIFSAHSDAGGPLRLGAVTIQADEPAAGDARARVSSGPAH